MIIRNRSLRTVVILGAGATRGALSGTKSPRVQPPLNGDFFEVLGEFIKTEHGGKVLSAYKRLQRFVDVEIGRKGVSDLTMEQVFNILFLSKDLPKVFRPPQGRPRSGGWRKELDDFITLLIRLFRFFQEHCRYREGIAHYERLVRTLEPNDCVMTLNYDTLIDNELVKRGWNPKSGYGVSVHNVNYKGINRGADHIGTRGIKLLKPHGSLNWYAKSRSGNLENVLASRGISQVVISSILPVKEKPQKRLTRLFIPPLYTKFFKNRLWKNLWTQVYKHIKETRRVIVIGCSMIETDYHLRSIIAKAMADRQKKFEELIIVVPSNSNPQYNTQKKLKNFFRGRAKQLKTYETFTEFIKKI
jgi:hypothetical protein